ncbi:MAG: acyl-CoA thioesterase [Candidatus Nealsonbacteria bacterium]|nr:acyl-CoA thioesterase [Candidatus Nealsonbacteria bacterium]
MKVKSVKDSMIETQFYSVKPTDLNALETIYGGKIVDLIDSLAAIIARRHSGKTCVTASMDSIDFVRPAKSGDLLVLKTAINKVWDTSCEIGVKIFVENQETKARKHLASAYLTFVALDENGRPTPMPKIILKTKEEKRRFREAEDRRKIRLARKTKIRE